jgi:hypothetical protein
VWQRLCDSIGSLPKPAFFSVPVPSPGVVPAPSKVVNAMEEPIFDLGDWRAVVCLCCAVLLRAMFMGPWVVVLLAVTT